MVNEMNGKQKGFTLIEIAIVLVIIGLLLGGVLKGQELITQAKIKNVANDLNGISAAVYAYQDRYRAFPGDDPGYSRWSGATAPDPNTNIGDNRVGAANNGSVINCASSDAENCKFWEHLRRAGLIAGDATSDLNPQNAVGGILHVQDGALGMSGLVVCTTNLPGKIANAIDAQFDDGKPNTGQVRGVKEASGSYVLNAAPSETTYTDDGSTVYALCKTM